jgi:serine protease Do
MESKYPHQNFNLIYIDSLTSANKARSRSGDSLYQQRTNIITKTIQNVSPAVVGINVKEIRKYRSPYANDPFWRYFFGEGIYNQEIQGLGSGYIISPDGYIVTNDHVAGQGSEITVTLSNGEHYQAKIIGTDLTTDICLLKIDGKNFPYVKLGDSDDIIIGEWAIAVGNPFGLFSISEKPTVTVGVISATGMNLSPVDNRYYLNMIQTDASINQGNSGGPLVNSAGEVIGMNTIIYTANGSGGSIGIGFAIPINKVKRVIDELKKNGKFDRDYWTGLRIQNVDKGIADYFGLTRSYGVLIKEILRNSPAEKAGFQVYDIIIDINGIKVDNSNTLIGLLQEYRTDDLVNITVIRDGKKITKTMKLERAHD